MGISFLGVCEVIILTAGRCGSDVVAEGSVEESKVDILGLPTENDMALVLPGAFGGGSQ